MAKLDTDGMDDFLAELNNLGEKSAGAAKRCLYDGAAVAAAAIRDAVEKLPLDDDPRKPYTGPLRVITERDRQDLADCIGISQIKQDASAWTVSTSFTGYISRTEKDYPDGVPAAMIARSIESGSSVRAKNPFFRRAMNRAKAQITQAMQQSLDESIAYTQQQEG